VKGIVGWRLCECRRGLLGVERSEQEGGEKESLHVVWVPRGMKVRLSIDDVVFGMWVAVVRSEPSMLKRGGQL
jgi:hypothetical protein